MKIKGVMGFAALVVPLLAILTASGWFAARAWIDVQGPPMPGTGYLAMTLGVTFSLIVGCGLMALLFYSSRHGYDEPYQPGAEDAAPEMQMPPTTESPGARSREGS